MCVLNRKKYYKPRYNSVVYLTLIFLCTVKNSNETGIQEHNELCNKVIFKLSLFSQQNEDGKWETHAQLDRGNESVSTENDQDLHLNITQTVVACNCTNKMLSVEADIVAPPLRPGKNYTFQPGLGYYYLHKTPYSWAEANYFCNMEGAHLTVIKSHRAAEYIKGVLKENYPSSNDQIFIGLQRLANGDITTLYGDIHQKPEGILYNNEAPTSLTDNCGTINHQGKINFISCNQALPFICEQEN